MESNNKYWKGLDELEQSTDFVEGSSNEFSEGLPLDKVFAGDDSFRANRRDFLKFFGFSIGAVALASCEAPIKEAVPYAIKPDNVTPGVPLYYASSSVSDYEGLPLLVKVREGRPIKFEPNKEARFYGQGLDGQAHASILSLYNVNRIKGPQQNDGRQFESISWEESDEAIAAGLGKVKASGKSIAIVTRASTSLVLERAIEDFKASYPNTKVIQHEAISYSGILRANEDYFGKKAIPTYHFAKAKTIVSFGADFLGTWITPGRFSSDYATNRDPKKGPMSKHFQFEALMSNTGANADTRIPIKASKMGQHLLKLYGYIVGGAGGQEVAGNTIKAAAESLKANKGQSIVVCGSNDRHDQILVNAINFALGNYGSTIDLENNYNGQSADEKEFIAFKKDAIAGKYGAAIFVDSNPAYSDSEFGSVLRKIKLTINNATTLDETAKLCEHLAPNTHALESWDIKQPYKGRYVFNQPTIAPVFNGRSSASSLIAWSGGNVSNSDEFGHAYNLTKEVFANKIGGSFNKAVEAGFINMAGEQRSPSVVGSADASAAIIAKRKENKVDLILYTKVGIRDGSFGDTPWVHEMPDPVSKVTWDNYLSVSMTDAEANGWKEDYMAQVTVNGKTYGLPLLIQPGQAVGTYGVALGYGRSVEVDNDLKDCGVNVFPLVDYSEGASYLIGGDIAVEQTSNQYVLARTQTHHTIEGRDIVRETSLEEFKKDPYAVNNYHKPKPISLWDSHDYSKGHHWGMAVDMSKCTGCSACIVSCSIENNVPIVGRDEIRRRREMHWIRIDRYYSFEVPEKQDLDMSIVDGGPRNLKEGDFMTEEKVIEEYADVTGSKEFYENVKVVHQPMMCQHCDNAPCETVCPVLATTHSTEGLNQMTYNRCIGTKYCGNNCPYKVRRFNWFKYNNNDKFDYHFNNDLGKMVINPDVTVRSRGVMEKCSFCVQRIQYAKLEAKKDNRKMKTDEFTVACAQTCPTNAIVFGDMNDPESDISKLYKDERGYHVIEEIGTRPSVKYLAKVRNT